ncbi:hypothetical protein [Caulobacter sp. NIBR1757]|uniref:hypothetical protein n=1 Tax=Caulobacter sp. NIBR1757 TaxID=3016000 RepID=UPI0022F0C347|nr:hypothetical protein [Caulobacter sp. NIBR1757]WGM40615.1 hypothetical protein AMEJIAPC_03560 [Caulobacter sp. NIBR1757]
MIFNDDSMLDFRGNGFGDGVDGLFGYDVGEVVITGRVPGALYVEDFSDGEYGLQHIQPVDYVQDELSNLVTVEVVDVVDASGPIEDPALPDAGGEDAPAGLVASNDDAPAALVVQSHGKDAEPLVLIPGGDSDGGVGDLTVLDLHDLAIPPIPVLDAPSITVTPPTFDDDVAPVIFGRAYQSLSFLIIDTPFAVGDSQLPSALRPTLNELLGLTTPPAQDDEDDGQAFVLPASGWGAWRLG